MTVDEIVRLSELVGSSMSSDALLSMADEIGVMKDADGTPLYAMLDIATYNTLMQTLLDQSSALQSIGEIVASVAGRMRTQIEIDELSTYVKQNDIKRSSA